MIRDAADGHERAVAGLPHRGEKGLRDMERGAEVDPDLHLEILGGGGLQRFEQKGAGVAHDDLRRAQIRPHSRGRPLHRHGVGHIAADVMEAIATPGDQGTREPDHPRPRAEQRRGDRCPDAARGTGHHRHVSVQLRH